MEAGSGTTDLSRWLQLPADAAFRGHETATDQGASPSGRARHVFAVTDAMAGAGHSADSRFSAEVHRDRTMVPRRTPSAERSLDLGISELESILTEIVDDVAAACS
jgi:putative intracellular protease/amidase